MKKYYENDQYNLAFDRWLNLMAELIIRHGPEVLKKLQKQNSEWRHVADYIVLLNNQRMKAPENYVVIEYFAAA